MDPSVIERRKTFWIIMSLAFMFSPWIVTTGLNILEFLGIMTSISTNGQGEGMAYLFSLTLPLGLISTILISKHFNNLAERFGRVAEPKKSLSAGRILIAVLIGYVLLIFFVT